MYEYFFLCNIKSQRQSIADLLLHLNVSLQINAYVSSNLYIISSNLCVQRLYCATELRSYWYVFYRVMCLQVDIALFVGDFGEEDVELVRQVAGVKHPKAVILGNHDAWCALARVWCRLCIGGLLSNRGKQFL